MDSKEQYKKYPCIAVPNTEECLAICKAQGGFDPNISADGTIAIFKNNTEKGIVCDMVPEKPEYWEGDWNVFYWETMRLNTRKYASKQFGTDGWLFLIPDEEVENA